MDDLKQLDKDLQYIGNLFASTRHKLVAVVEAADSGDLELPPGKKALYETALNSMLEFNPFDLENIGTILVEEKYEAYDRQLQRIKSALGLK